MAEWPKRYHAPQDILGGELDDGIPVIPADLGRELVAAMRGAVGDLNPDYDNPNWKRQARERLQTALARYESQVDPVPGGMSSGEGEATGP